jgi:protein arginine kinase activator
VSHKLCDACGKQPANLRYTEIVDGSVKKSALCRVCAEARGLLETPSDPGLTLKQLLTVAAAPASKAPVSPTEPMCGGCGLSFAVFRKTGRLGCPACYTAFETELAPLLRKIHHNARHVGKAPRTDARQSELRRRVQDLRAELERAVRAEDYERAAALRDEMRAIEQQQQSVVEPRAVSPPPETPT